MALNNLRVVACRETTQDPADEVHTAWVAQVLEHEVACQAPSLHELLLRLELSVKANDRLLDSRGSGLERLPRAPRYVHEVFEAAKVRVTFSSLDGRSFEIALPGENVLLEAGMRARRGSQ